MRSDASEVREGPIYCQTGLTIRPKERATWAPSRPKTLVLHGDDDQIVPIADSALLSSKIIPNAILKVIKGAPHGLCTTMKDQINEELLAFIKA